MTAIVKYVQKVMWWTLSMSIAALVATAAFFLSKRFLTSMKKTQANVVPTVSFDTRDVVNYTPVPGKVLDTTSDMTVHSVLSGGLGPAIIMIYADWCVHCNTMMPAFDAAASKSSVPFIKIQGQSAPVTSQKYKVLGYPTVLGVDESGTIHRFSEQRTEENLIAFSKSLTSKEEVITIAPETIQVSETLT